MNATERKQLKKIANHIMLRDDNIMLQEHFACVYDDLHQICEPNVWISMSDYRTLCYLAGCLDTLTIKKLPHKNSTDYYPKKGEEDE